jgi:hypothetical protein
LATRAGISVRGSSTEGIAKASYRMEFRDEWDNDRPLSPLGMPADGDWVMSAPNYFEPVLIHNPFMHQLSRDLGRYSPNTRFVEVYFVGSGTGAIDSTSYAGIYVLMDRIEVGKDRVDAGTLEPENLTLPSLSGGYLMKIDRLDPGDFGIFAANQGVALVDPREDQLKLPARAAQLGADAAALQVENASVQHIRTRASDLTAVQQGNRTDGLGGCADVEDRCRPVHRDARRRSAQGADT